MNYKSLFACGAVVLAGVAVFYFIQQPSADTAPETPEAVVPIVTEPDDSMEKESTSGTMESVTTSTESDDAEAVSDASTGSEVHEVTITASNFKFDLSTIKLKKGERVRIVFKNSEGMHDFKIDEFDAATKKIRANETDTIEFTADKAGTFEYYCSIGSHRQMGMKGTLVVE